MVRLRRELARATSDTLSLVDIQAFRFQSLKAKTTFRSRGDSPITGFASPSTSHEGYAHGPGRSGS